MGTGGRVPHYLLRDVRSPTHEDLRQETTPTGSVRSRPGPGDRASSAPGPVVVTPVRSVLVLSLTSSSSTDSTTVGGFQRSATTGVPRRWVQSESPVTEETTLATPSSGWHHPSPEILGRPVTRCRPGYRRLGLQSPSSFDLGVTWGTLRDTATHSPRCHGRDLPYGSHRPRLNLPWTYRCA